MSSFDFRLSKHYLTEYRFLPSLLKGRERLFSIRVQWHVVFRRQEDVQVVDLATRSAGVSRMHAEATYDQKLPQRGAPIMTR